MTSSCSEASKVCCCSSLVRLWYACLELVSCKMIRFQVVLIGLLAAGRLHSQTCALQVRILLRLLILFPLGRSLPRAPTLPNRVLGGNRCSARVEARMTCAKLLRLLLF